MQELRLARLQTGRWFCGVRDGAGMEPHRVAGEYIVHVDGDTGTHVGCRTRHEKVTA